MASKEKDKQTNNINSKQNTHRKMKTWQTEPPSKTWGDIYIW